jgi:hypothetical protein
MAEQSKAPAQSEDDKDAQAKAVGKARHVDVRPGRLTSSDPDSDAPTTLLDDQVNMPGYVAPGDGPFDTVDPSEHATSVVPDKGNAAREGFGVVNAVLPVPDPSGREQYLAAQAEELDSSDRTEEYEVAGPDGKPVRIRHNLDTGETVRA